MKYYEEISAKTGIEITKLEKMSFSKIVYDIILPKMVGLPEEREDISDDFMNLMANHHEEMSKINPHITTTLLAIAFRRVWRTISFEGLFKAGHEIIRTCSSCFHSYDPRLEFGAIPQQETYDIYSTPYLHKNELYLTQGVYNFIFSSAMDAFLESRLNHHYAMTICQAIMHDIKPPHNRYYKGLYDGYNCRFHGTKAQAQCLYMRAKELAEKYGTPSELQHYYTVQWRKHIDWFSENYKIIDWDLFFHHTLFAYEGFERFCKKWEIKLMIKGAKKYIS